MAKLGIVRFGIRRVLCLFCVAIWAGWPIGAQAEGDALLPYEQAFFSHTYEQEALQNRLERLEQSVFGEVQTGSDLERQNRLLGALKSVPRYLQQGPNLSNGELYKESSHLSQQSPRSRDATDYPTVTAIERTVFGRDFIRDDVTVRLNRLEKREFGEASPQQALVDRVDRLLAKYPEAKAGMPIQPTETSNPVLRQLPSDPSQFTAGDRDVYAKVEALERRFFNQTDTRILLTERLDLLEQKAYGRTHSGESIDTRVNRLMSQFQTARSSARPSRLQPHEPQIVYDSGTPRQNVQIGAGFRQNSQIQFSQDLLNMLPNDVRAQFQNQSGSGTVVSAPGTVVIEQSKSTRYPGFQSYCGAPMQYYNYYGAPGTTVERQTTTTVIQPNGSSVVYGYNTVPEALQNPAYVGDPAFLQQLNSVEANVFGRVDAMLPVQTRLQNLETAVLRKTQPHLPEVERLNAVFRAWKIRQISQVIGAGGNTSLGIPLNSSGK